MPFVRDLKKSHIEEMTGLNKTAQDLMESCISQNTNLTKTGSWKTKTNR
jgi:hypothetical protein